ncbi:MULTISPECIES: tetratricopeptide repeat protein [Neobacillus]|uniref:Tetratricopeptide repeat protein n=1 Tax=Neobacillus citreus TaxID=2833578 RepID=A0A942SU16_9BACI|nr:tetratricopeptide repeat protein [Neobacillus citreus]MCH6268950.1 tetratricopeptide repeat protein [Neobacillus citreus]
MTIQIKENDAAVIEHYFHLGRYEAAAPIIENQLRQDPKNATALFQMAVVEMSREDFEEARKLCCEAMQFGYSEIIGYHFIGSTYQHVGMYKDAEEALLAALKIDPLNGEVIASYGYLMLQAGHDKKALALLEQARELEPFSDRVNQLILHFYFAKADSKKQQEYIRNVLETSTDEVQNLTNIAMYHALKGEVKEARECYRQAFLLNPADQNILALLGEYDSLTHPLFAPQRFVDKIGGPAVVWITFMVMALLLNWMELYIPLIIIAIIYVLYAIYSWTALLLYKWFVKGRL